MATVLKKVVFLLWLWYPDGVQGRIPYPGSPSQSKRLHRGRPARFDLPNPNAQTAYRFTHRPAITRPAGVWHWLVMVRR
ncbi:hypothetical protein GGR92_000265 [Spirosoma lacussanchae]